MKLISRQKKRKLRKFRSRLIKGDSFRPRVVICKTNRYLIAQAIDDNKGHTLLYLSTANIDLDDSDLLQCRKNIQWAEKLGDTMAGGLLKEGIKTIVFDRNGFSYHGKVQSFGEAMRKKGIKF